MDWPASLAESVELIDPLLCLPPAGIPRVPRETGHGDESAELGGDDADGRGVRAQVLFHRGGGRSARHPLSLYATVDGG